MGGVERCRRLPVAHTGANLGSGGGDRHLAVRDSLDELGGPAGHYSGTVTNSSLRDPQCRGELLLRCAKRQCCLRRVNPTHSPAFAACERAGGKTPLAGGKVTALDVQAQHQRSGLVLVTEEDGRARLKPDHARRRCTVTPVEQPPGRPAPT